MVFHIGNVIDRIVKPEQDVVVKTIKDHTGYGIKKTSYQVSKGVLVLKNISPLLKTKIFLEKKKICSDLTDQGLLISDII